MAGQPNITPTTTQGVHDPRRDLPQQRADKRVRVDLHNPTPATRVIYDGIENSQRPIIVRSGETAVDVEISDVIAKELRDRTKKRGKEKSDVTVHAANTYKDDTAAAPSSDEDPDTED